MARPHAPTDYPRWVRIGRILVRRRLLAASPLADWRRRSATLIWALVLGLVALLFAKSADLVTSGFHSIARTWPYLPIFITPAIFAGTVWLTRRYVPDARGSGIPQVIAASRSPASKTAAALLSLKTAIAKMALTLGMLAGGGAVGREGPTVQISAAIMTATNRRFGVRMTPGVMIAGGAAGVAAAFNTPLAGIAFAIEELAAAYEQRLTVLVMGAVMIAGMVSLGIAGDYVYFGRLTEVFDLGKTLVFAPLAGLAGGLAGGLFSRILLAQAEGRGPFSAAARRPVLFAMGCGIVVAVVGLVSSGSTFGTGYQATRALLAGEQVTPLFGPGKFLVTLATALSGAPGGIFAPSLAVGAGLGQLIDLILHGGPPLILLAMTAYFVGVVRAPFTAVIIVSEATGNHGMILPLFATALLADWVSAFVCPTRLYHGLSQAFMPRAARSLSRRN